VNERQPARVFLLACAATLAHQVVSAGFAKLLQMVNHAQMCPIRRKASRRFGASNLSEPMDLLANRDAESSLSEHRRRRVRVLAKRPVLSLKSRSRWPPQQVSACFRGRFLQPVPDLHCLAIVLGRSLIRIIEICVHLLPGRHDRAKDAVSIELQSVAEAAEQRKQSQ
jgi:hypothetical protein